MITKLALITLLFAAMAQLAQSRKAGVVFHVTGEYRGEAIIQPALTPSFAVNVEEGRRLARGEWINCQPVHETRKAKSEDGFPMNVMTTVLHCESGKYSIAGLLLEK